MNMKFGDALRLRDNAKVDEAEVTVMVLGPDPVAIPDDHPEYTSLLTLSANQEARAIGWQRGRVESFPTIDLDQLFEPAPPP